MAHLLHCKVVFNFNLQEVYILLNLRNVFESREYYVDHSFGKKSSHCIIKTYTYSYFSLCCCSKNSFGWSH